MARSIASVEELIAARDACGFGSDDIARRLKLAPRQVQALEAGDWTTLPGTAFVRGALRSYGRLVDADVEPLLQSVAGLAPPTEIRPAASLDEPMPRRSMLGFGSGGSGSRIAWIGLLVIGVVALAFFFARDGDFSRIPSLLGAGDASAPAAGKPPADASAPAMRTDSVTLPVPGAGSGTATADAPAAGGAAPATGAASPAAGGSAPGGTAGATSSATTTTPATSASPATATMPGTATTPNAATTPATAASASPSTAPATPAGTAITRRPAALRLHFERESWIEVRRPDGTVLLSGVQAARSVRDLAVSGPLLLVIGNADAVRVEADGAALDLAPYTRSNVARVNLP